MTETTLAVTDTIGAILDRRTKDPYIRHDSTYDGYDHDLWKELAQGFGLCAMHAPAEFGGADDTSLIADAITALGSRLSSLPYLPTIVFGSLPLLTAQRTAAGDDLLDQVTNGEAVATGSTTATLSVRGGTASGRARSVLHGAEADWLVLTDRDRLIGLRPEHARIEQIRTVDLNRPLADIEFADAEVIDLGAVPPEQATRTRATLLTMLAHESAAGCRHVTDTAIDYARTREQFGRPIGSFQAIKHICAEMCIDSESAAAVAWAATEAQSRRTALAAFVYTAEAFVRTARESLHVHGGIGFTWEFESHMYYRRAYANTSLMGRLSDLKREYVRHALNDEKGDDYE